MMTNKNKKVLIGVGVLAAFLLGGAGGVLVGGMRGFRLGQAKLLNEVMSRDARRVRSDVSALAQLRSRRTVVKGIEAMELSLNDALIMFDPETPYPDVKPEVEAEVEDAISAAMAYRKKYPRRRSKDMRDDMVKSLFDKRRAAKS
jgi:hypothetical protein